MPRVLDTALEYDVFSTTLGPHLALPEYKRLKFDLARQGVESKRLERGK